ncbi:hypothetical protein I4U23_006003 [Adineta vaga]|nr:hypothetical protein I4U23_006003 [Adineta vaga]
MASAGFNKRSESYDDLEETKSTTSNYSDVYINPIQIPSIHRFPISPLVTPYDIIIHINSLAMLSTAEDNHGVIVAIIGSYNRGKSFLLNQLCNIHLPHGNLIHTEDLSITAGRNLSENIIFIDTAGTDTAIPRDKLDDKKATEALLRELSLHLSSYIIIVVDRLRATDQSYIRQVLKHCENLKSKDKNIIIVHNLMDVETIEDVKKVIKEEIEYLFDVKPTTMNLQVNNTFDTVQFFHSKQNNINLSHFIFTRNGFDAAKIWNRRSIDGIINILQTAH